MRNDLGALVKIYTYAENVTVSKASPGALYNYKQQQQSWFKVAENTHSRGETCSSVDFA